MQKFQDRITVRTTTDGQLIPVAGATVLVRTYPGLVNAQLYSDNAITSIGAPGTLLTTDANGLFSFYAADGRYQLDIVASGYTFAAITDILLEDPQDGNVITASYLELTDGVAAPGAVAGKARLYIDAADGDLKIVYADGVIKTIVVDT